MDNMEEELEPGAAEAFNGWKDEYRLEAGPSRIASLTLPSVPPPSPPKGVIAFPDEAPVEPAPVPEVSTGVTTRSSRSSSRMGTPALNVSSPRQTRSSRPPSPKPAPQATVSLNDILPRRTPGALDGSLDVPPWEPVDNYNPAEEPQPNQTLKVLMPLENDYASQIPRLPAFPPGVHRHRKGSKGDSGRVDSFKLSLMYNLNPLSNGVSRSPKCVLTSDWRVAQAELRLIRTMERIEAKKASGRWSLRQPKKHRGPPVPKSHWDWLLDEMVSRPLKAFANRTGMDASRLLGRTPMEEGGRPRDCLSNCRVASCLARGEGRPHGRRQRLGLSAERARSRPAGTTRSRQEG